MSQQPNSVPKTKVRYICIENKRLREKLYYRQEYLEEFAMWGRKRQVTLTTFRKKAKQGYEIEYKVSDVLPPNFLRQKNELDSLIDLALSTHDKAWFMELTERRNNLFA